MHFENITALYHSITGSYTNTLKQLYKDSTAGHLNEIEITTLLNFNREIFTAFKSFVFGVKDSLLIKSSQNILMNYPVLSADFQLICIIFRVDAVHLY